MNPEYSTCLIFYRLNSRKINIILLDDARIQRVEVHDKDELVPKATLRLEHQTTLIFVSLALRLLPRIHIVVVLRLDRGLGFLTPLLVRTDILQSVELV
jgi:hypothetical protein